MVTGIVNGRHEAVIRISVRNSVGQEQQVDAVIDTGFTGSLTLPPSLVTSLGLVRRSRSSAMMANWNIVEFDQYAAAIVWDGKPRRVLVQAVDNAPLVGTALLIGHELRVKIVPGGTVHIESLP